MLSLLRKKFESFSNIVFANFAANREDKMAFVSHKVSVVSLLSLFAMSLLVCCATADNKTNQPSYKMVSDFLLQMLIFAPLIFI